MLIDLRLKSQVFVVIPLNCKVLLLRETSTLLNDLCCPLTEKTLTLLNDLSAHLPVRVIL
jgi:hypothetical protein